jgi:8-oxo-dGTP diphosphatase
MVSFPADLTLELIPHCASVPPQGWAGDHLVRPLTELGLQQAQALVEAVGIDVDAIYSSPALRCLQTIGPLARVAGQDIIQLAELLDTQDFAEPQRWTQDVYPFIAGPVGGSWSAGCGLRALLVVARGHEGGRVVAASHGDIIPAFLAMLCAAFGVPLPRVPVRGGWYTLRFASDTFTVTMHGSEVVR